MSRRQGWFCPPPSTLIKWFKLLLPNATQRYDGRSLQRTELGVNQQTELAFYFISSEHKHHYLFAVNDGGTVLARVYVDTSTGLWGLHSDRGTKTRVFP